MRAGLERLLAGAVIRRARARRADLRTGIPDLRRLDGRRVAGVRRRAKYLLIDTDGPTILNHLGMTGRWHEPAGGAPGLHDHVILELTDGRTLAFNDARRFGVFEFCRADGGHDALDRLGPEPLSAAFAGDILRAAAARHRRAPIKAVIMDQAVVVGVGNIYAAESLFRAGIAPALAAGRVRGERLDRLAAEIRAVLSEAIAKGGSTIDDYRQVNGLSGLFQNSFAVYGRDGQPCSACGTAIRVRAIGGRSSFWCPRCQR